MSFNNVLALALLLKKSIGRKSFQQRMRKTAAASATTKPKTTATKDKSLDSSSEIDDESILVETPIDITDICIDKVSNNSLLLQEVKIRDFAYSIDSPLHYGKSEIKNDSIISLSSPEFNGREAKALFDFSPETEYEIALKVGQSVWVQYRQCPGWLIADVQDETGLIPESYIEFI